MRVLFISEYDAFNPLLRSGVPYFIQSNIKKLGYEVTCLHVQDKRTLFERIISQIKQFYFIRIKGAPGLYYNAAYTRAMARSYRKSWRKICFSDYDKILTISPQAVAYLPDEVKPIIWIDNSIDTFSMYPGIEKLAPYCIKEALLVEKKAFQKAGHIFTASVFLKNFLTNKYPGCKTKINLVPRGANLHKPPEYALVKKAIETRLVETKLQLLFANSCRWENERKGGSLVIETYLQLKKIIPVTLTILGSIPSEKIQAFKAMGITCIPTIQKSDPVGEETYRDLLLKSHFLFMPSIADGFGIMYAEAAHCGLPSIAKAVMGVTESVKDKTTGYLLDKNAGPTEFKELILKAWFDKNTYSELCFSAFEYAGNHFFWHKNLQKILLHSIAL
jgi:glycosyltransferase involved in cell wall biosynthesis